MPLKALKNGDGVLVDVFQSTDYVETADAVVVRESVTYPKSVLGAYTITAATQPGPGKDPLPPVVDAAKAKYILAGEAGSAPGKTLLDDASAAVDALCTTLGNKQNRIKFDSWLKWAVDDPLVQGIVGTLGLSQDQFETLWRAAFAVE